MKADARTENPIFAPITLTLKFETQTELWIFQRIFRNSSAKLLAACDVPLDCIEAHVLAEMATVIDQKITEVRK